MRLVLLGPPGAGKGTQAVSIAEKFNIPHISTGDIFRANIKAGTELGKRAKDFIDRGELVPDSFVVEIVDDRLNQDDCKSGFLLDGFPRNIFQAESFDKMLEAKNQDLNSVVNIKVDNEVLVKRATGRRICKECGATYHVMFNAPKVENVCDKDGGELYQRPDDTEETVANRINVYVNETSPLIEYYTEKGIIANINGEQDIAKVFEDILKALEV